MGECQGGNTNGYLALSLWVTLLLIGQTIATMDVDNGLWTQTMNLYTKVLNTQQKREGGTNVLKVGLF